MWPRHSPACPGLSASSTGMPMVARDRRAGLGFLRSTPGVFSQATTPQYLPPQSTMRISAFPSSTRHVPTGLSAAPAPVPRAEPLGVVSLLRVLATNPLEAWTEAHFEEPIVSGGLPFGRAIVVSEPAAIRRVLLDTAGNYEKDWMQRRILSAGLSDGLLSAEGHQWRVQRRALAPLFSKRGVMNVSGAVAAEAQALVERLA